jgi:hypothetical protein
MCMLYQDWMNGLKFEIRSRPAFSSCYPSLYYFIIGCVLSYCFFLSCWSKKKVGSFTERPKRWRPLLGSRKINAAPDISIAEESLGDTSRRHRDGSMDMAGCSKGCTLAPSAVGDAGPRTMGGSERRWGWDWERQIVGMKNWKRQTS